MKLLGKHGHSRFECDFLWQSEKETNSKLGRRQFRNASDAGKTKRKEAYFNSK